MIVVRNVKQACRSERADRPANWQAAGAQSKADAAGNRIRKALGILRTRLEKGELQRVPTVADVCKLGPVDRKTLIAPSQRENFALVQAFFREASCALGASPPARPAKRLTYYQRNADEVVKAEAVRIVMGAKIDALTRELADARQVIKKLSAPRNTTDSPPPALTQVGAAVCSSL